MERGDLEEDAVVLASGTKTDSRNHASPGMRSRMLYGTGKGKGKGMSAARKPDTHQDIARSIWRTRMERAKFSWRKRSSKAKLAMGKGNWHHFKPSLTRDRTLAVRQRRFRVSDKMPRWCLRDGYRLLRVATANPGGINANFDLIQITRWMAHMKLDIVGVQETHAVRDARTVCGDYLYIGTAGEATNRGVRIGGV